MFNNFTKVGKDGLFKKKQGTTGKKKFPKKEENY